MAGLSCEQPHDWHAGSRFGGSAHLSIMTNGTVMETSSKSSGPGMPVTGDGRNQG